MSEKLYEMLWDCRYCGARKLLGKTHRHCPSCGAPQENAPRYFPPEDEKVAVEDHEYVGADVVCPACGATASRKAAHCGGCGSPLQGAREVARRTDQVHADGTPQVVESVADAQADLRAQAAPAPRSAPAARSSRTPLILGGCGCLLALLLGVAFLVVVLWRKEAGFEVVGHSWQRSLSVERFTTVEETKWCDELPSGATDVRRSKAKRSTTKVPDGEDCKTRKIDQGDGTYKEKRECTPRYREEPVMDDECRYKIKRWKLARTEKASGTDRSPRWPDARLAKTGDCEGCEREGSRSETYTVHLKERSSGKTHTCDVDEKRWTAMPAGSRWKGEVLVVTGGVSCSSLAPE